MPNTPSSPERPVQTFKALARTGICAVIVLLAATAARAGPAQASSEQAWEEDYAWSLARQDGSPEAYQWFLDRYPDSRFSNLAFEEIIEAVVTREFGKPGEPRLADRSKGAEPAGTVASGAARTGEIPY